MALHWEHIKGFNGDAATGSSTTAGTLYTYIEYQKGPKSASPVSSANEALLPNILVSSQNIQGDVYENGTLKSGVYSCGHIVTTDIENNFIASQFFNNYVYFKNNTTNQTYEFCNNDGVFEVTLAPGHLSNDPRVLIQTTDQEPLMELTDSYLQFYNLDYINLNNVPLTITGTVEVSGYIKTSDYCEALYFNATSDKRVKENFIPVSDNLLDLVKNMEVYTFNYKSHPSQRSIGLIAQDLKDINIDGFSLVENPDATGEDGDYMSIHESKLVYILLEAVKELSAKVDKLEEQLYGSK